MLNQAHRIPLSYLWDRQPTESGFKIPPSFHSGEDNQTDLSLFESDKQSQIGPAVLWGHVILSYSWITD